MREDFIVAWIAAAGQMRGRCLAMEYGASDKKNNRCSGVPVLPLQAIVLIAVAKREPSFSSVCARSWPVCTRGALRVIVHRGGEWVINPRRP
ncbi:hypothetical protein [Salinisphaera aquimarina]|uniref:Uncharacterized protein n=1 Tax=Salinisphaera aquimarina TaxID=2094031 RepID=A0ABV7EMY3_9GAMM